MNIKFKVWWNLHFQDDFILTIFLNNATEAAERMRAEHNDLQSSQFYFMFNGTKTFHKCAVALNKLHKYIIHSFGSS